MLGSHKGAPVRIYDALVLSLASTPWLLHDGVIIIELPNPLRTYPSILEIFRANRFTPWGLQPSFCPNCTTNASVEGDTFLNDCCHIRCRRCGVEGYAQCPDDWPKLLIQQGYLPDIHLEPHFIAVFPRPAMLQVRWTSASSHQGFLDSLTDGVSSLSSIYSL
jgi:hypothetical protein